MAACRALGPMAPLVTLVVASLAGLAAATPTSARLVRSHQTGEDQQARSGWVAPDGAVLYDERSSLEESDETVVGATQDGALEAALNVAKGRAKFWAATWNSGNNELLQKWLGVNFTPAPAPGSKEAEVRDRLQNLHGALDHITFKAAQADQSSRCDPPGEARLAAYAVRGKKDQCTVYLCQPFYLGTDSKKLRAAVLQHEALHCLGTVDLAYTLEASEKLHPALRWKNTQSYIYFVSKVDPEAGVGADKFDEKADDMVGTVHKVDCTKMTPPGELCPSLEGVCKVRMNDEARGKWSNCESYCSAKGLECTSASFTESCFAGRRPKYNQQKENRCLQSRPEVCWCEPIRGAFWGALRTSTTTAREW